MIKLFGYGVTAGAYGYTVGKVYVYKAKKTGVETEMLATPHYYSDLQGCLRYIRRQMHYDALREFDGSIIDAIDLLKGIDEMFEKVIASVEKHQLVYMEE